MNEQKITKTQKHKERNMGRRTNKLAAIREREKKTGYNRELKYRTHKHTHTEELRIEKHEERMKKGYVNWLWKMLNEK